MKELYRKAFLAILANDLQTFKQLIISPSFDLLITDQCHPKLEKELGGTWYVGGGVWENNTLLNLALSLERLDFVEELIKQYKAGRDIGLTKANDPGISPLHMALMVGCNKPGDNKEQRIAELQRILPVIWRETHPSVKYKAVDESIGSAIGKIYHLPAIVAMQVLDLCRGDLASSAYRANIKYAIQELISGISNLPENASQKENILQFISWMKKDSDYGKLLDEVLIEPMQGLKTPLICTLLDTLYRPAPYHDELGYVPENEITLALITPAIYGNRETLKNTRGQTLGVLLFPHFPDLVKSEITSTSSSSSFFSKSVAQEKPQPTSTVKVELQEKSRADSSLKAKSQGAK